MRFLRREAKRCGLGLGGDLDTSPDVSFEALSLQTIVKLKADIRRLDEQVNAVEAAWIAESRKRIVPVVRVPTDVLHHALTILQPVERMAIIGGRRTGHIVTLSSTFDVTAEGPGTSYAHVRADPDRLRAALLALERSGAHIAGWIHSHPGRGWQATQPSPIDRAQHGAWVRDYCSLLVSLIIVVDGVVRMWGTAVEERTVEIEFIGAGVTQLPGHDHVFQLDR